MLVTEGLFTGKGEREGGGEKRWHIILNININIYLFIFLFISIRDLAARNILLNYNGQAKVCGVMNYTVVGTSVCGLWAI